jgi:hypothetical protein
MILGAINFGPASKEPRSSWDLKPFIGQPYDEIFKAMMAHVAESLDAQDQKISDLEAQIKELREAKK